MKPSTDEPIELRTVHPAPPASTKVHGKTFVLQTASNPYRVDDSGKYSDKVQNDYKDGNPWDEKAPQFLQYVREGGQIFFIIDRKSTRLNSSHGYISYAVF